MLPDVPEALAPEITLMPPLEPWAVEPVCRVALPLGPAPDTPLEDSSRLPEPVETPTPVDTTTRPPVPVGEVLVPAEITTAPPSAEVDAPTLSERLPEEPPDAEPVATRTEPDGPLELDPLPM